MVYAIYEDFWSNVEKKLNRVAKKCVKHGNEFTFEVKGEEIRKSVDEYQQEHYYKFVLVDVEGTARIDDWECIAVLEIYKEGNVIRRINTEIEVPERFKTSENVCEHCNTKRHRKQLYIVHNTVTDEWKQVGGDCLMLYTHGLNIEYVAAYMDGITELAENDGVVRQGGEYYYSVREILGYADTIISRLGYFNADSDLPTKTLVKMLMYYNLDVAVKNMNSELERFNKSFDKRDFFEVNDKRIDAIIDYYKNLEADTEFLHNIHVMLSEGYVKSSAIGFLAYLPEGYNRYIQKEEEKAKNLAEEKSEYFGEIGKRYKDLPIRSVKMLTYWCTDFGTTYVHKIVLEDGHILTWKTNNAMTLNSDEQFDKITFTVKAHKEYKGQMQTEVTRCKVTITEG